MTSRKSLTCVDLFAGCGGLSLGLEEAGFRPLAFCELNKDAADSYAANRQSSDIARFSDVAELTPEIISGLLMRWRGEGIERVDLVCGGPPCQGFSGIGHRRSYQIERAAVPSNHLYKEMIRIIRAVKPRAFLFENVRGLLSGRWTAEGEKGEIWRDVRAAFGELEEENYVVSDALLQAKDYGVPQNRPRVFIVGVHRSIVPTLDPGGVAGGLLPEPTGQYPDLCELLDDLIDPDYLKNGETRRYLTDPQNPVQLELRTLPDGNVLREGDPLSEQLYSRHSPAIRAKFEAMHANNGVIPPEFRTKKFAQRLLPSRWDNDGPNITATSLPDDFVHYRQPRTLTVREWARLQTFPDWYQFRGPRTTGGTRRAGIPTDGIWTRDVPRYTQIGNAVAVRLAAAIGRHLANILG
jgi:DNA (cytosine-5)-methyltransferase 1